MKRTIRKGNRYLSLLLTLLLLLPFVMSACSGGHNDPAVSGSASEETSGKEESRETKETGIDHTDPVERETLDWVAEEEKPYAISDVIRPDKEEGAKALYKSKITGEPSLPVLTAGKQVLALDLQTDGSYIPHIYLYDGTDHVSMFDGDRPLMNGMGNISSYEMGEQGGLPCCIMKGTTEKASYTLTVSADAGNGLFRFDCSMKTQAGIQTDDLAIGPSMKGEAAKVYDQAPMSIYGADWFAVGMSGAYLWDAGREAVILFDFSLSEKWMDQNIYMTQKNGKVGASLVGDETVFGLYTRHPGGMIQKNADILFTFWLYGGFSVERTGAEAVAVKSLAMKSVFPTTVSWPTVRSDCKKEFSLSWDSVAAGTAKTMLNEKTYTSMILNLKDPILTDDRFSTVRIHYDRQYMGQPRAVDFSCNNDWLSAGLAWSRIVGEEKSGEFSTALSEKMDTLPFYYDAECNMLRYGIPEAGQAGKYEMPWQNLFFMLETYRASLMSGAEDFNPAALSNLLCAFEGVTELLEKCGYVFAQWSDPYGKQPVIDQDRPNVGIVYEPWQVGTYAYVAVKLYEITKDTVYLEMAKTALTKVIDEVSFTVKNEVYERTYTDSGEFPITETFGSGYGIYAAYRLFALTGEEKYLQYSEDFFGNLMQLCFWFDDNFSREARKNNVVGLFQPHSANGTSCPWETIEAYLPMVEILDACDDYSFNDTILAMLNCMRINAFRYYPPTWDEVFRNREAYNESDFYCIPTEPLMTTWGGTEFGAGNANYGALYMANISFWNDLLFEIFGSADDRDILVLNTHIMETMETALQGADRSYIVYNPTADSRTFRLSVTRLHDEESYILSYVQNGSRTEKTCTGKELSDGIGLTLAANESIRVAVKATDGYYASLAAGSRQVKFELAEAYYRLGERVREIAYDNFSVLFPDADENRLQVLSDYVLTCQSYEDAMGLALTATGTASLKETLRERKPIPRKAMSAYEKNEEVRLPAEYAELQKQLDEAFGAYKAGKLTDAHRLCETILQVLDG